MNPTTSTSQMDYKYNALKFQAGADAVMEIDSGTLIGGAYLQYIHGKATTESVHGDGHISTDGYGLGGTFTWQGHQNSYIDTQAQAIWYNSDLREKLSGQVLAKNTHGFGYALSAEAGHRIAINHDWSIIPQAQLSYTNVGFSGFTDVFGAHVKSKQGDSLQGRPGIMLEHNTSYQDHNGHSNSQKLYGIANLYYEFLDGTQINVANTTFTSKNDRLWGGLGLGGQYSWNNEQYSFFGEGLVDTSLHNFGDSHAIKGSIGLRIRW